MYNNIISGCGGCIIVVYIVVLHDFVSYRLRQCIGQYYYNVAQSIFNTDNNDNNNIIFQI